MDSKILFFFAEVKMKYINIADETPCTRCAKSETPQSIYRQPGAKKTAP